MHKELNGGESAENYAPEQDKLKGEDYLPLAVVESIDFHLQLLHRLYGLVN